MILYEKIEKFKSEGFINNETEIELQIKLAENLYLGDQLIFARSVLTNNFSFYLSDVKNVLYPVIVYFTKTEGSVYIKKKSVIHKFIEFCENNLKIKYNLDKYNDDYLLVTDFIKQFNLEK
jgi:virulence-associated protein VapD